MKLFFDSSVLVPVFYADHPRHAVSAKLFLSASKVDCRALRTLGEVYATLTGLPVRPRITSKDSIAVIKQIRERLTLVTLTEAEYVAALESNPEIVGVAAYDALIAQCALKCGAEALVTWNTRDFTRLDQDVATRVKTPVDL